MTNVTAKSPGFDLLASGEDTVLVLSGGTATATTVATPAADVSAGLVVAAGGVAVETVDEDGGLDQVNSGGSAIGTTVSAGGTEHVFPGAASIDGIVSSGGTELVFSGGTSIGTTISSSGIERGSSGALFDNTIVVGGGYFDDTGTASELFVSSGGFATVDSGDDSISASIFSGGIEAVAGVDNNGTIESGGLIVLDQTAVVSATNVLSGGTLLVVGGTVEAPIIASGGTEEISSSFTLPFAVLNESAGTTSSLSAPLTYSGPGVAAGVVFVVGAGATARNTQIHSGGTEIIASDGSESIQTTNDPDDAYSAGTAIVGSSGLLTVSAGGTGYGIDVHSAGEAMVLGEAQDATVESGGSLSVLAGGTAVFGLVNGGEEVIFSGGTANATSVGSGGTEMVDGHVTFAVVSSGGQLDILTSAGGTDDFVLAGGSEIISSGGTEAIDQNNTLKNNTSVGSIIVGSSGLVVVSAGGTAFGLDAHFDGVVEDSGLVSSALLESNGFLEVSSGGTASNSVVNNGGYVEVHSGGTAFNTQVSAGGTENVLASGEEDISTSNDPSGASSAGKILVASGGFVRISAGGTGFGLDLQSSGLGNIYGTESGAVIESGGQIQVLKGGTASADAITGFEYVTSGGSAVTANVKSGGLFELTSGGIGSNTQIGFGGTELVSSGSTEIISLSNDPGGPGSAGTVIVSMGGHLNIAAGGTGVAIQLASGAVANVSGTASATTVQTGADLLVQAGGTAISTTLTSGFEVVYPGAFASADQIGQSGIEDLYGQASNISVGSGGEMDILLGGTATGTMVQSGGTDNVGRGTSLNPEILSGGVEIDPTGGIVIGANLVGGAEYLSAGSTLDGANIQLGATVFGAGVAGAPLNNAGLIDVSGGTLAAAGGITGDGVVQVEAGSNLTLGANAAARVWNVLGTIADNGYLLATDPITVAAGGLIAGSGQITGALTNSGSIAASGGLLDIDGAVTGTGTFTIDQGATLELDAPVQAGQTIAFAGTGTLLEYDQSQMDGTIVGQQSGDAVLACFAEGTLIRSTDRDVPVEQLAVGDDVVSALDGKTAKLVWIGHRHVACRSHPNPASVWPIRIQADAFAANVPQRDLWLSPDHAILFEDVLVPVRFLVNGHTIVQEQRDAITYWHIELPRHSAVFAEGLACESYLDTGNRHAFANGGAVAALHPEFAVSLGSEAIWEAEGCAKLRIEGEVVARLAARLARRARAPGHSHARPNRSRQPKRQIVTCDPRELLCPAWYLAEHEDVRAAGVDAATHYADDGRAEGRLPCSEATLLRGLGLIDPVTVAVAMSDIVASGHDPVAFFCDAGWRERRRPNPYFDTAWYLDQHDVPDGVNPLLHYVLLGETQGLPPGPHFDPAWYRHTYSIDLHLSPLAHYLLHRSTQRFSPNANFDVAAYKQAPAGRDPYAHYMTRQLRPVLWKIPDRSLRRALSS